KTRGVPETLSCLPRGVFRKGFRGVVLPGGVRPVLRPELMQLGAFMSFADSFRFSIRNLLFRQGNQTALGVQVDEHLAYTIDGHAVRAVPGAYNTQARQQIRQ